MTFSHLIAKQPASTLEFQYFYCILQINFCEPRQKQEERPFSAGNSCAWAGLWPVVTLTLSTSRSFQNFLRHNVGNFGITFSVWLGVVSNALFESFHPLFLSKALYIPISMKQLFQYFSYLNKIKILLSNIFPSYSKCPL